MGTSKRYAEQIDRAMDARVVEIIMRGEPTSLSELELQLDVEPLTKAPVPRRVRAWVRYGSEPVQVDGEAVAWTARAVAVRWSTPAGLVHRAWVWASAVDERDTR